ncbi:MAG: hypothetical protein AAGC60_12790 [Acidobacteriota bacterium]
MSDRERPAPPNNSDDFESLCLDLWRVLWDDPRAQKVGRRGQSQEGLDLLDSTGRRAVQCKQRDVSIGKWLTIQELDAEVEDVVKSGRALDQLDVATTGPRDKKLQARAEELTEQSSFEVRIWSWADIWHELDARPDILREIEAKYLPRSSARGRQRVAVSRLPTAPEHLLGRNDELARLDAAWADPETHVVSLVAWGGVGKTSLVATWAARLARKNYDGADVFDWSFYSQGSRDQSSASGDRFIDRALRFFGDESMADSARSAWEKGARLAELVARRKTLLVLDGLEPLQHGEKSPLSGELKDPGVAALLRGLAQRNSGLCVVTTRVPVEDLETFRRGTAPEWRLEHLSTEAGVALLGQLGVDGARKELEALVNEVRGHALTLHLVGRYLALAHGGDVRRRDRFDFREVDAEVQGGHACRAMAAYESWLEAEGEVGARMLAVLRILGLFDRPADAACLAVLRWPPASGGLTDAWFSPVKGWLRWLRRRSEPIDESAWDTAVSRLVEAGLVVREAENLDEPTLDAHPLVREHFGRRLRDDDAAAWRAGHGRIYEHLTSTTEHRPDSVEGLEPLYQAVAHGCWAGRVQEACEAVYIGRILRGMGPNGFYSTKQLGAFGADLGAVACFFEQPWSRLAPSLAEAAQAWLLNQAAFRLRALGRLLEAVEPMRVGLERAVAGEDWRNAAIRAGNLSELELTLGDVDEAVRDAERSVDFADRSGDAFQEMSKRTTLADALHQAGRRAEALERFVEAEAMQAKRQPRYPLLYSLQGFRYCDLLLADAERAAAGSLAAQASAENGLIRLLQEVERRALQTVEWAEDNQLPILTVALDRLTIGRVRLYGALLTDLSVDVAEEAIKQAVDGLRRAGDVEFVVRGLFTRAWLRAAQDRPDDARRDLDEAEEIARRGPMPLYLADIHLYRARLFDDRDALAEARRLVEKHGYGRRREELEDLEARL